jgi:hypothetical protein
MAFRASLSLMFVVRLETADVSIHLNHVEHGPEVKLVFTSHFQKSSSQ